ncbi:hypothetical protein VM1G_04760 [Cytospora mali]|uniref:Uncharacterized protein n=1 Tax=Cytospora mali TaxID=578113 RepID=A0A194VZE9_CYTMA|nr:hypothetical protein VM1G_04760 [Valsa mali]
MTHDGIRDREGVYTQLLAAASYLLQLLAGGGKIGLVPKSGGFDALLRALRLRIGNPLCWYTLPGFQEPMFGLCRLTMIMFLSNKALALARFCCRRHNDCFLEAIAAWRGY